MDLRTGDLYDSASEGQKAGVPLKDLKEVEAKFLTERARLERKARKGDPCPCGSGKKFGQCCRREPRTGG